MKKDEVKAELGRVSAVVGWAFKSQAAPRINAMIELARPELATTADELDKNPWLFNCPNGTIDLQTGKLREHRREDFITKLSPTVYDPRAEAPTFQNFLRDIFDDDPELITYIHRFFGLCLSGDVREQLLQIFWGGGANGKSTLINAISHAMGEDYLIKANRDLFMVKKQDSHPAQMARLFGKRLVVCIETGDGSKLDEALVKELTGGDRIAARGMREDWWEFDPSHKAVLVTNHRPEIKGTDHAIWRRVRLIPFTVTFTEKQQDKQLTEKLKAEAPGILRWMVEGCLEWQRHGLGCPEVVKAATDEYRDEQDKVAAFLTECCEVNPQHRVRKSVFVGAFQDWCKKSRAGYMSTQAITQALADKNIDQDAGRRWYVGVAVTEESAPRRSFD